ncbi:MAG: hypothetical protein ABIV63_15780 [Caldimonas sp.]
MEVLLEILLEFFGEALLQIFAEALVEIGLQRLVVPSRQGRSLNPYLATIGYVLFGAVVGALSLWLFPTLFIRSHSGRIANAVVTPFVAGATMVAIGAWRRRRDQPLVLLDRFAYAYLFALVMALVRLRFGG